MSHTSRAGIHARVSPRSAASREELRSLSTKEQQQSRADGAGEIARYDFHGIGIEVIDRSGTACSTAIDRRLAPFSTTALDQAELRFAYASESSSTREAARRPSDPGRPVYDTVLGEVLYYEREDVLWATTHEGSRMLCDCRTGTVSVVLASSNSDGDWLGSRPFFTLPLVELMKRNGFFCVHAAGLVADDAPVIIAGPSGSGKTTLTLALLRAGFRFLSDDMLFLRRDDNGLTILSFPDELDVTPSTARLFPELRDLAEREPEPGWPKHRLRAEEAFAAEVVAEARPGVLVIPERVPGSNTELIPVELDSTLLALAPNVLLTESSTAQRHLDSLADLVGASDCYQLRVGDDLGAIPLLLAQAAAKSRR